MLNPPEAAHSLQDAQALHEDLSEEDASICGDRRESPLRMLAERIQERLNNKGG